MAGQRAGRAPRYDVHPQTGAAIEVFYADRSMETFGRCGAGWFWCSRRPGFSPEGPATGPFPTSYAAYRHAMNGAAGDFAAPFHWPQAGHTRQLWNLSGTFSVSGTIVYNFAKHKQ